MQKITPFLWFDSNAEEAMNYYVSVFLGAGEKNSRIISIKRYPEGPLQEPMKGMEGKVLTGIFELAGQRFMALDGGPLFKPSIATSFLIECRDQEEIDYYWEKLTAGGDPKNQQCGWLSDKFGFSWQVVPDMNRWFNNDNKDRADRAMQAMLKMKKIDIQKLEDAYNS